VGFYFFAALFATITPAQQTPSTGSGQAASTGSGQAASTGSGQPFPVKPVRIVVSAAAGTGLDATTRLIAPKLSDYWKQPLVIDNRQGLIANSTVAKATPDGYTLLFVSGSIAVRHVMFANLPYDTFKDFAGVTELYASNSRPTSRNVWMPWAFMWGQLHPKNMCSGCVPISRHLQK
jgi:hypothetical protein